MEGEDLTCEESFEEQPTAPPPATVALPAAPVALPAAPAAAVPVLPAAPAPTPVHPVTAAAEAAGNAVAAITSASTDALASAAAASKAPPAGYPTATTIAAAALTSLSPSQPARHHLPNVAVGQQQPAAVDSSYTPVTSAEMSSHMMGSPPPNPVPFPHLTTSPPPMPASLHSLHSPSTHYTPPFGSPQGGSLYRSRHTPNAAADANGAQALPMNPASVVPLSSNGDFEPRPEDLSAVEKEFAGLPAQQLWEKVLEIESRVAEMKESEEQLLRVGHALAVLQGAVAQQTSGPIMMHQ